MSKYATLEIYFAKKIEIHKDLYQCPVIYQYSQILASSFGTEEAIMKGAVKALDNYFKSLKPKEKEEFV
jgi:hypothetical protein